MSKSNQGMNHAHIHVTIFGEIKTVYIVIEHENHHWIKKCSSLKDGVFGLVSNLYSSIVTRRNSFLANRSAFPNIRGI